MPSKTLCVLLGLSECDSVMVLFMRTLQSHNFKQLILLSIKTQKLLLRLIPAVQALSGNGQCRVFDLKCFSNLVDSMIL